jgi:hypothetical protein
MLALLSASNNRAAKEAREIQIRGSEEDLRSFAVSGDFALLKCPPKKVTRIM